jgi:nucleoside-diphosphate kinase
MGPTHIKKSREQSPMSIRGQFAFSDTKNCVHGSDSISNANEEIQFFFPEYTEMNE